MKTSSSIRKLIHNSLEGPTDNILLFGSVARGDSNDGSDIDVLQLARRRKSSYRKANINVSVYDASTLHEMAVQGSLFVLHLKLDGQIIADKGSIIENTLRSYQAPPSYAPLRASLRRVLMLLDVKEDFYFYRWKQLNDLILYITRTLLYSEYAEAGTPLFSLRHIASTKNSMELNEVLSLKKRTVPDWSYFITARRYLENQLQCKAYNPLGSVEALIVGTSNEMPLLVALGLRLLSKKKTAFGYDLLTSPTANVT